MLALAAVAASGVLFFVSTGLGRFWPAAWIAPIPVLWLAFRSSARKSAVCASAAWFLGSLNLFSYLASLMPVGIVMVLLMAPAAVFALTVLFARYCFPRLTPWLAVLAFPAAWTSYEFLISLVSPHGSATSLAYSQVDFLPLVQLVSITGLWGIVFLLTLFPAAVAVAWTRRSMQPMAAPVAIILMVVAYGVVRLREPAASPVVRVGLAATDGDAEAFASEDPARALAVARAYADRAARLASQGALIVVLPEKLVGVTPDDLAGIRQVFSQAARSRQLTLIAGWNMVGIRPPRNVAVVFAPDGAEVVEYDKRHMLPGPETGYATGASPGLFHPPGVVWGVEICKDMDFPSWSREYGRRGVRILAVPAWDFVVDGRLDSRMAVLRGVENGITVARAARQGNLTFSDAYGRILAEQPTSRATEVSLIRDLGPGPGATVYTRFGDWFGWLSVLALAALLIAARTAAHAAERGSMTSK